MTCRLGLACTLLCAVFFFNPARALAQAPQVGPSMPLPLAVDLAKVPVGSWSEYRVTAGTNTMSVRMALVSRSGRHAMVETQIQGGPVEALGRTTVRMSLPLAPAVEIKPTEQVIQLGDNPPMSLPGDLGGAQAQSFKKLDPKKRVGVDTVTVAGGTFPHADHYRDQAAGGETFDFWISKTILPFGLLKVTSSAGAGSPSVAMELTGHGKGAKPVVTKPPQPFDPAVIMRQTQNAIPGATPPGGGPPPRMIPSPHPGMPPTPASSAAKARRGNKTPGGKTTDRKSNNTKTTDGKTTDGQDRQN
jgi:hypothetical protein